MDKEFTISLTDNGYYKVSIPNYDGGKVIPLEIHEREMERLRDELMREKMHSFQERESE